MLGEDEEWLWEFCTGMFPEDGGLHVYGIGEDGVPFGIKNLQDPIHHQRAAGKAPPPAKEPT